MSPRRAALIGIVFPVIAVVYAWTSYMGSGSVDWAGTTMLIALGGAMSIMAYVLFDGLQQR
jgi:hypothetical protein